MDTINQPSRVKQYNVLYVDDDIMSLKVFRHSFKDDYNIFTANNAEEAIDVLAENQIDLIITDQQMPGMEGSELLMKIVPMYPNIIRILITGENDIETIISVVNEVGLDKYIVKPWEKDTLKEALDRTLNLRREQRGSSMDYSEFNTDLYATSESIADTPVVATEHIDSNGSFVAETNGQDLYEKSQIINDNINLKESLLPKQEELQLYFEDAFILHDHYKVNKHGYWFGERNRKVLLSSFNCNAGSIQALAFSTFVSTTFIELFYKEEVVRPDDLISTISDRINTRFFSLIGNNQGFSMDISILVYDRFQGILTYASADQNLVTFNELGQMNTIEGNSDALSLGSNSSCDMAVIPVTDLTEAYLVPNSELIKTTKNSNNKEVKRSITKVMNEIHTRPMAVQQKFLRELKFKSVIGMKF